VLVVGRIAIGLHRWLHVLSSRAASRSFVNITWTRYCGIVGFSVHLQSGRL